MKKSTFFLLAFLLFYIGAHAQGYSIFVKIIDANGKQINGEVADKGYENQIAATNFGQENINCTTVTGGAPCSGKSGRFIFNMVINKSLPLLKKALFSTEHLTSIDIIFRKPGSSTPFTYYKIRLENVIVTHITDAADLINSVKNQVELDAARFGWTYIYQSANGGTDTPIKFGWDIISNTEWTGF